MKFWNKIFVAIVLVTLFPAISYTATATLFWNPVPDATGYKMYYGTASHMYETPVDVGNATTGVLTLDPGDYFFAVTAYNDHGESGYSVEVSATIPIPYPDKVAATLEMRDRELWMSWPAYSGKYPTYGFRIELDGAEIATLEPDVTEYNFGPVANGPHSAIITTWNEYCESVSDPITIQIELPPIAPDGLFTGKITWSFKNGLLIDVEKVTD